MFSSRKREKGSPRARPARSACCSGDIMPFSFHCSNRVSIVMKSFSGQGKWIRSLAFDQDAPLRPMSLPILHCNRHVRAENTVEKHQAGAQVTTTSSMHGIFCGTHCTYVSAI